MWKRPRLGGLFTGVQLLSEKHELLICYKRLLFLIEPGTFTSNWFCERNNEERKRTDNRVLSHVKVQEVYEIQKDG